eukprot:m.36179 g.36179  ORF g.36179 m.36179 type:complete len:158 (+) comp11385_c0_seq1:140-613(+)
MVRFKNRYLLVEVRFEDLGPLTLNERQFSQTIKDAVASAHGDFGIGSLKASLAVKYFNAITGIAIIRCNRDYFQMLWSAVALVNAIQKRTCLIQTLHVGGTIRSCQKMLVQHNYKQLLTALSRCTTHSERQAVQAMLATTTAGAATLANTAEDEMDS